MFFVTKEQISIILGRISSVLPFKKGTGSHSAVLKDSGSSASANYSVAAGYNCSATGLYSHVEGCETIAKNRGEHAEGRYNKSNKISSQEGYAGNTRHSVGIGTSGVRKNAFEIMENGDAYLYGIGGYNGTNPSSGGSLQTAIQNAGGLFVDYAYLEDEAAFSEQYDKIRNANADDKQVYLYVDWANLESFEFVNGSYTDFSPLESPSVTLRLVAKTDSFNASPDPGFLFIGHLYDEFESRIAIIKVDICYDGIYGRGRVIFNNFAYASLDEIDALFTGGSGGSSSSASGGGTTAIDLTGIVRDGDTGNWSSTLLLDNIVSLIDNGYA